MGGGGVTTLKSSDNSVILNADPNGEIDIRRNNYICRQEQYFDDGDAYLAVAVSAIFRPTQEQDLSLKRRAQTFVLTNKNGFYARITIMTKATITDAEKDIIIFAEGDTSSYNGSVGAYCFESADEQDAFVVMVAIASDFIDGEIDENDRIYVSTDGDNTFVDFVHDYGYVEQNYDELVHNELFSGNARYVLPSLAYVESWERLKVNDTTAYIDSPKIVPFSVAMFDAFNGGSLIQHDFLIDTTDLYENSDCTVLPLFHKVKSSQDNYDFYTSNNVTVKNYTDLTDEELLEALQSTNPPTTFVVSMVKDYNTYYCTFYSYRLGGV